MFDVAPTELLIIAVVALVVIGPKDLPQTMRHVGRWVGKARGVARHFRSGFDAMVREAELEEMEKRWAAENARIMREHPPEAYAEPAPLPPPAPDAGPPVETASEAPVTPPPAEPAPSAVPVSSDPPMPVAETAPSQRPLP